MTQAMFHLECGPDIDELDASEADISRVFAMDDERSEHIVLTRDDGSFLHAAGEGDGPYMLVFHDEPAKRNYRAHAELSREEARDDMLDFFRGGSLWWDENDWTEVKHTFPWTLWAGLACLVAGVLCGVLAFILW